MKFRHADIPAALALVREQLEEEGKRLFAAGAKAMTDKDAATAKSILKAHAKLQEFEKPFKKLVAEWAKVQKDIDGLKLGAKVPAAKPLKSDLPPEGVKVGKIARKFVPLAIAEGKVDAAEFATLTQKEISAKFRLGGRALLKKDDGSGKADLDTKGRRRYYTDIAIPYGGANYLLTSQIFPNSYGPLVKWLKSKGYKKSDIDAAGKAKK